MRNLKLLFVLTFLSLSLSACSLSVGSGAVISSGDGGLWTSADKGRTWRQNSQVPSVSGKAQSLGGLDISSMTIDPQDSSAIYLGTVERGLYYTYNLADGWFSFKSLNKGTINDVKVDPKNKCIIYAAITNRLYRSSDCGRDWQQVYYDNNPGVFVNTIAIDHYNSDNVYIGTSRGEVIKSIDHGISWRTIQRVNEAVASLLISPQDSRLIFVASSKNDVYSFNSNTVTSPNDPVNIDKNYAVENWSDLGAILKDFKLGTTFRDMAVSKSDGTLLLATNQGLVRSPDQGITWESIKLLPTEKDATINAIAISPKNSQEIYYVTNTTFYSSGDGGVSWSTKKLSTTKAGWKLMVDNDNPNIIYLGTKKIN